MTAIPTESGRSFVDSGSKVLALLVVALGLGLASVIELGRSSVACDSHRGRFTNDFSPDFDIDRTECRLAGMKNPVLQIWGGWPYLGLRWE
jgi:hypothetical protein